MKKGTLLFLFFLIVAMVGGVMLVNQNQEMRKGATFANTSLLVLPSEKIIKSVNDTLIAHVMFETESGTKVDGVQALVCYGNELELNADTGVVTNSSAGFESGPIVSIKDMGNGKSCATVVTTSKQSADKLSAAAEAFNLNFKAVKAGSGEITITKESSMVTGDNSASTTDKTLAITAVTGTTYQINDVVAGDSPILNYKVSYGNVKAGDAKCVVNWPMTVIVLSNGVSKSYTDVKPTSSADSDGRVVFQGKLVLSGFGATSNVAAFVKGPKHLQMKYAVQNQSAAYDKAGGELTLTKDESSPVYNFSAYPMIPGDVVGPNTDTPDGWIDGVDFAYVKARSLTHETVSDGGYLKADLDGNCQVNSNDVNVLKISLQTKQGQLY